MIDLDLFAFFLYWLFYLKVPFFVRENNKGFPTYNNSLQHRALDEGSPNIRNCDAVDIAPVAEPNLSFGWMSSLPWMCCSDVNKE